MNYVSLKDVPLTYQNTFRFPRNVRSNCVSVKFALKKNFLRAKNLLIESQEMF